jgi:hypothetical protein
VFTADDDNRRRRRHHLTRVPGPPAVIVCVDCGGRAHLVQEADPEMPYTEGDIATYRCEDCLDRWDLVVTAEDVTDTPDF